MCCRACLEYEDAQVRVGYGKTARDDAASRAAYNRVCLMSEKSGGGEAVEDNRPPAMIISYSSLIGMGVDIISCFEKLTWWRKLVKLG